MEELIKRLNKHSEKLDTHTKDIEKLKTQMEEIKKDYDKIERDLNNIETDQNELKILVATNIERVEEFMKNYKQKHDEDRKFQRQIYFALLMTLLGVLGNIIYAIIKNSI